MNNQTLDEEHPFPIGSELWIKWKALCKEIKGSVNYCPFWDKPNNTSFDTLNCGRLNIFKN